MTTLETAAESEVLEKVEFGRSERRGVLFGMNWLELIYSVLVVVTTVVLIVILGFPLGLLVIIVMVILLPLGMVRPMGESILVWILRLLRVLKDEKTHQNEYVRDPETYTVGFHDAPPQSGRRAKKDAFTVGAPHRLVLPGDAGELLVYECADGSAMLFDPVEQEAIVAAKVTSVGFDLDSKESRADRSTAWGTLLSTLGSHAGVKRVQALDQTVVAPTKDIKDYYQEQVERTGAGPSINPMSHQSYLDLVDRATTNVRHHCYIVLVIDAKKQASKIRDLGGGILGLMVLCESERTAVGEELEEMKSDLESWLSPRGLGQVIRETFDPASQMLIAERTGEFEGVAPESAGPMGGRRNIDSIELDSAIHRAYAITEWPRRRVLPGFLNKAIFAGEFRHTVSIIAHPYSAEKALKEVEGEINDMESGANLRDKAGMATTQRQKKEEDDVIKREEELVDGHSDVRFTGFITISAGNKAELARAENKMQYGATKSFLEIRPLYTQQWEGMLAGAVPLGRGLK